VFNGLSTLNLSWRGLSCGVSLLDNGDSCGCETRVKLWVAFLALKDVLGDHFLVHGTTCFFVAAAAKLKLTIWCTCSDLEFLAATYRSYCSVVILRFCWRCWTVRSSVAWQFFAVILWGCHAWEVFGLFALNLVEKCLVVVSVNLCLHLLHGVKGIVDLSWRTSYLFTASNSSSREVGISFSLLLTLATLFNINW